MWPSDPFDPHAFQSEVLSVRAGSFFVCNQIDRMAGFRQSFCSVEAVQNW